jgi:hypothetical protein
MQVYNFKVHPALADGVLYHITTFSVQQLLQGGAGYLVILPYLLWTAIVQSREGQYDIPVKYRSA